MDTISDYWCNAELERPAAPFLQGENVPIVWLSELFPGPGFSIIVKNHTSSILRPIPFNYHDYKKLFVMAVIPVVCILTSNLSHESQIIAIIMTSEKVTLVK